MSSEMKSCPKISVLCNEKQSISNPVQLDLLIGKDITEEIYLLKRPFGHLPDLPSLVHHIM